LQFYNSVVRDSLFDTFTEFYCLKNRLVELSQKLRKARIKGFSGGEYFEELFLVERSIFNPMFGYVLMVSALIDVYQA